MTAKSNTKSPPKRKTPEKELFRGTTMPLCVETRNTIDKTRKYYDLVDGVDSIRYSVAIAVRTIEIASRKNCKLSLAAKVVESAAVEIKKWQSARVSGNGPNTEPKFMRLRDRDFDRIERVREFLIDRLGLAQDKLTQSDAIQFSLIVEAECRSVLENALSSAA